MDDPRTLGFLAAHGVITRAQAHDHGLSGIDVAARLRRGEWVVVHRGVYTTAEIWEALDEYVGRPLLRARAVVQVMKRGWVLSHDSAAHLHGLPILRPATPEVHITRPGFTNAWTENGVAHHLARFARRQVVEVEGLPALNVARTAVDIAREHGLASGVVACDGALRMGVARADLEAAYAVMTNWPYVRTVRTCVDVADGGAANPHESMGRLLVLEAGLESPETQFPVRTPDGVKWCDLRVGNHVIETDGRVKYRSVDDGGVAWRGAEEVAWEDYWGERRQAAIRRLRADHADSVARYGSELDPALAAEARDLRAARDHRSGA